MFFGQFAFPARRCGLPTRGGPRPLERAMDCHSWPQHAWRDQCTQSSTSGGRVAVSDYHSYRGATIRAAQPALLCRRQGCFCKPPRRESDPEASERELPSRVGTRRFDGRGPFFFSKSLDSDEREKKSGCLFLEFSEACENDLCSVNSGRPARATGGRGGGGGGGGTKQLAVHGVRAICLCRTVPGSTACPPAASVIRCRAESMTGSEEAAMTGSGLWQQRGGREGGQAERAPEYSEP